MSLRGILVVAGSFLLWSVILTNSILAAPAISNIQTGTTSITKFDKFEANFQVTNTTAKNYYLPFDQNPPSGINTSLDVYKGITVNAYFRDPDGNVYLQPAFYYQDFQDIDIGNREWLYPTTSFTWKVRFSPHITGQWSYYFTAQDASGTASTQSTPGTFTVTNSSNHGFIKVSSDSRYFEYDDGTYFPGLGYNLNGGSLDNVNPTLGNISEFSRMGPNGIELSRVWVSQFSIFGEAWGGWSSDNRVHALQEQRSGIVNPISSQFSTYPTLQPPQQLPAGSEYYKWLVFDEFRDTLGTTSTSDDIYPRFTPCRYINNIPLKRNTSYRVRVRYQTRDLEGPKVAGPFGFAVKSVSENLGIIDPVLGHVYPGLCNDQSRGTVIAASYNPTDVTADAVNSGWSLLSGIFNSGDSDFSTNIYLTFNNVKDTTGDQVAGHAFIDEIWIEEASCTSNCANLINKPRMSMHQYFNQRQAFSFDKVLDLAKQYGVYLKAVMLEKNDRILNTIGFDGQPVVNQSGSNFYGNGTSVTKVRWLQQAWWRYMQGRWGYSPNIHSWELLNEGDSSTSHYVLADEFGKYMHCRLFGHQPINDPILGIRCDYDHPNSHLVSTSFHSSGGAFALWNNGGNAAGYKLYRDIDYADRHYYAHVVDTIDQSLASFWDSALFSYKMSMAPNFTTNTTTTRKPFIRGETAWNFTGRDYFRNNDERGVWLHDFIWGGINSGGLLEHFFLGGTWEQHIYKGSGDTFSHDHRPMFKHYYDFIKDIPLNNTRYQDASASASVATMRAWGQKDTSNNRAHLWVQNTRHTWCTIITDADPATTTIDPVPGCPQPPWASLPAADKRLSGTVTINGFVPNTVLPVQWWYFDETANLTGTPITSVSTNSSGSLVLDLNSLPSTVVDVGVKIGNYGQSNIELSMILENWLTSFATFDQNFDGKVNSLDFVRLFK
jgi:hypothetical protein